MGVSVQFRVMKKHCVLSELQAIFAHPMKARSTAYLQLHIAVLLFGLTGILGDLISIPKPTLVWWRMAFAVLSFLFWPGVLRDMRRIALADVLKMVGIGCLVAMHWVTFFVAIQITNVSVTLAMLASGAFFTALLEPIIIGRKFKWFELALGLMVIPGVAMVVGSTAFPNLGIVVALLSACLAAVFSILNKSLVGRFNPITMTMVELGSGWMLLSLLAPFYYFSAPQMPFFPVGWDWFYISVLAFACTSLAYVFSLNALRFLPTFTVNLSINLEPIYTIILAYFILNEGEELNLAFYLGASVIIASVFLHPILSRKFDPDSE